MSDLLVIEFPTEAKAEGVREILLAMQEEYLIEPGDAVIAVRDATGRMKLNQLLQPAAQGVAPGMFWGALIRLVLMAPPSGALDGRLTDLGVNDEFVKQVARTLQSGNAALLLRIRKTTTDKVLAGLRGVGGTVLRSWFDETKEESLQAARTAPVEIGG